TAEVSGLTRSKKTDDHEMLGCAYIRRHPLQLRGRSLTEPLGSTSPLHCIYATFVPIQGPAALGLAHHLALPAFPGARESMSFALLDLARFLRVHIGDRGAHVYGLRLQRRVEGEEDGAADDAR